MASARLGRNLHFSQDSVLRVLLAELDYWCHARLTSDAWLVFWEDLLDAAYRAEPPTHSDLVRCGELQRTYSDLSLGVVDASVIALAERLGEPKVATLDHRHFSRPNAARFFASPDSVSDLRFARERPTCDSP
jgi:predicted nucleic acid-binding protein